MEHLNKFELEKQGNMQVGVEYCEEGMFLIHYISPFDFERGLWFESIDRTICLN